MGLSLAFKLLTILECVDWPIINEGGMYFCSIHLPFRSLGLLRNNLEGVCHVINSHDHPPITARPDPSFTEICWISILCTRTFHDHISQPHHNPRPLTSPTLVDMGFFDSWSDLVAAASPWSAVEAEAVESTPAASEAETKVRLDPVVLPIVMM